MRTGTLLAGVVVATLTASCSLDREGTWQDLSPTAGSGGTHSIGDAAAGSGGADASSSGGGTGGNPTGGTGGDPTGGTGGAPTGGTGGGPTGGTGGDPTGGTGGAPTGGTGGDPTGGTGGDPTGGTGGDPTGGTGGDPTGGTGGGPTGGTGGGPTGGTGGSIQAECGNDIVEAPEACDDNFTDDCGSCNATCTGPGTGSLCGDGQVCPETETCDDNFTDACGSCNATCSAPGTGSLCGDGQVCPETETCDDGETNACGPCNASCTASGNGQPCVTQAACADGSTEQVFQNGMAGCAGKVTRAARATLCGAGSVVCTSVRWVANRGSSAPSNHYWVEDALPYYSGSNGSCSASATAGYGECNAGTPMRVCTTNNWSNYYNAYRDPLGNLCNWGQCGLDDFTNDYFGGCNSNNTAGALCCLP